MRPGARGIARAVVALCLVALAACEKKPPEEAADRLVLTGVSYGDLPGWAEDPVAEALPALRRSCARLEGKPADQPVGPGGGAIGGTVADWRPACAALAGVPDGDGAAARAFLESWFVPFKGANNERDTGTITGYYEAELDGALFPGEAYRIPVYGRPDDLVTADLGLFRADLEGRHIVGRVADGRLVPYHSRREIDDGVLGGRALELLWAEDPVDVFFLHVQGSGRVRLPDGAVRRIGYAANNGHGFTGIGRMMIREGKIPPGQASMQSIRDWLRAHPEEAVELMQRNARFIFFRWIEGDGPIGAQGVALTAGRSIAVDPAFLPLGAPVYLDTTYPGGARPLRRLVVAQDAGAAIKGPLRADFFWGTGEAALEHAGRMKEEARFYLLLPKAVAARRRGTS